MIQRRQGMRRNRGSELRSQAFKRDKPMRRMGQRDDADKIYAKQVDAQRSDLKIRCRFKCENPFCRARRALDRDHVEKRRHREPGFEPGQRDHEDNILMLCRACHDSKDNRTVGFPGAPLVRVENTAAGTFRFGQHLGTGDWDETVYVRPAA